MEGLITTGDISVCCAGDSPIDSCSSMPDQNAFCILVGGAFDLDDELYTHINYSEYINVFAPGMTIKSAGTTSTASYITRRGTSAAEPDITGSSASCGSIRYYAYCAHPHSSIFCTSRHRAGETRSSAQLVTISC